MVRKVTGNGQALSCDPNPRYSGNIPPAAGGMNLTFPTIRTDAGLAWHLCLTTGRLAGGKVSTNRV